ncbi:MAG: SGNH/GDSL hydrolase family protein [Longimicrobiales bacterium]
MTDVKERFQKEPVQEDRSHQDRLQKVRLAVDPGATTYRGASIVGTFAIAGRIGAVLLSVLVVSSSAAHLGATGSLEAQVADPEPERFAEAIESFTDWDAKNTAPADAVLFVGSSSIRFWDTAEWFPQRAVINRGFGGSHTSDVNHYVGETVIRHAPDVVVFYAGDNDIGADKPPQQVHEDFLQFTSLVLSELPDAEILFVSIKPSLARWSLWPEMVEANELIRAFTENSDNLHYVDVATPMLGSDGEPVPELFVQDGLHMTDDGYEIWTEVVGDALEEIGY